ncbi:type IV pilus twitching motility protein PilT [Francisella hispaniensis]|uniref:Twitching motility protein PilT n=1 Tax=Francisella hispaniensis FSC454 TaxID=1088883 RepID=A0AAC9NPP2_9GAMM|nr:type IV pilus twitching motility protein PilT [Francisella hispaniensis]APD51086.1 twitching motility protein PilT [Francisella hispaniensis FSC454]KYW86748.1 twitching motility protein PilT [Francisella hispaniensis FSC454]
MIRKLLTLCVQKKASDLHLSSGCKAKYRIDGDLIDIESSPVLNDKMISQMLLEIMTDDQKDELIETYECDFSIDDRDNDARFRVNAFFHNRGYGAVFRRLENTIPTLDQFGAPRILKEVQAKKGGLILVTGPTGSGKSSTLAALVNEINHKEDSHILTIEDPVEFVHTSQRSLVNQREVKRDTKSFNAALKSALREDPDCILVGEMRDLETIRLALEAAETGHLVLGTLHTMSAIKTVDRVISVFPPAEQELVRNMLAESLQIVISQRLLKRKGGGRVAAYEVLISNTGIRNMIKENKLSQIYTALQTGTSKGMATMEQSIENLLKAGTITPEEAAKYIVVR